MSTASPAQSGYCSPIINPKERMPVLSRSNSVVDKPSSATHQGIRMPPSHLQAKSASEWKAEDLKTLRVDAYELSIEEFFGCHPEDLPRPKFTYPHLEEILEAGCGYFEFKDGPPPKDFTVINFFKSIESVSRSATEANVDLLALVIMTHLGYQLLTPDTQMDLELQYQTYFEMDGDRKGARVDVALLNKIRALLCVFVEDKRLVLSQTSEAAIHWPHPQVTGHGLGAYNKNMVDARLAARKVARLNGENTLHESLKYDHYDMVIPAFTLIGSCPCFYLIPITAAFASAVARGEVPPHPTKIFYCVAPLRHPFVGMMEKNQRYLVLQMFEAFKSFIPTSFAELCRFESRLGPAEVPRPINPTFSRNAWDFVREFLWESNEHCKRAGADKHNYPSSSINYFYGSGATADTQNHEPFSPQLRHGVQGYPSTLNTTDQPLPVN